MRLVADMSAHGLDQDYPLLMEQSRKFDFVERLGGCSDPLMAEIDKALRELWDAHAYLKDEPNRV
jgi:hypothetical protein